MTKRIAIIGGGIAGVTAVWQLARLAAEGAEIEGTLFEASSRLGGVVETVRSSGFVIECGPDAWVTEKPWARELAEELGLVDQIIPSNDATRKTYILIDDKLVAMPDGMRMMVPGGLKGLDALEGSSLFSEAAKSSFRAEIDRADELKAAAPDHDESVGSFVERHFGLEVLEKIGAPLLSGVFGGDVTKLSVRAVMGPFVQMEREHGSLILALEERARTSATGPNTIFTTLRGGTGALVEAMVAQIPPAWVRSKTMRRDVAPVASESGQAGLKANAGVSSLPWDGRDDAFGVGRGDASGFVCGDVASVVTSIERDRSNWRVETADGWEWFDALILAAPADVARRLVSPIDASSAGLMEMEASSAVVAGFAFTQRFDLPPGFGFLVPPGSSESQLLAGTFVDQKFDSRAPAGGRLIRGFFGGANADGLLDSADEEIAFIALKELMAILGPLPKPAVTVVRRWPRALPQYTVGHLERMAELFKRIESFGNLWLIGNGYRGVGLPDLVRDARTAAHEAAAGL